MLDRFAETIVHEGDLLYDPMFDENQILDEVIEDVEPEVTFYTDGHIGIGESVYEIDELCEKLLKTLAKNPSGVELRDVQELFFGGYKGYTKPSTAQSVRFQEAIDYISSIESETGTSLFAVLYSEVDPDNIFFESAFVSKYARKPYVKTDEQYLDPEPEESHPDVPDKIQHQVVDVIVDLANHVPGQEGRIYRKTLNLVMMGNEKPTFDQNVVINKALVNLNEWFFRRGIKIQFKSIVTPQGPAIQVSDVFRLEELQSEVNDAEALAIIEFEDTKAQQEAIEAMRSKIGKRPELPKKPHRIVQKEITKRSRNSFMIGFNISPVITDADAKEASELASDIAMDVEDVLAARILLGRAILNNSMPTGGDEVRIILFYQRVLTRISEMGEEESTVYDYQMWADASFGVLILNYEKRISVMASKLSGNSSTRYEELKVAGLRGLEDGIKRYTTDNGYVRSYLPLRIHGEMVDYLRTAVDGPRDEEKRLQVTSLDAPIHISSGKSFGEELALLDTVSIPDLSAEEALDKIERGEERIRMISQGLQRLVERRLSSDTERDIRFMLLYFGIESLMSVNDLALYQSLRNGSQEGVTLGRIGKAFGVSEGRASQIVSMIMKGLREALDVESLLN